MKKIVAKLLVLSLIMIMIIVAEEFIKAKNDKHVYSTVYVTNKAIEMGTQLDLSMLKSVDLPSNLLSEYIVTTPIDGYLLCDLKEGEFLYQHQVASKSPLIIKDSQRLITIKCSIIESNGWAFTINDCVDIILVNSEVDYILENAIVTRIFNDKLNNDTIPEYVSLLVSKNDAMVYYKEVSNSRVFISHKSQEGL